MGTEKSKSGLERTKKSDMAVKSVLVLLVAAAVISMVKADSSRSIHQEECPKQGLCPYVTRLFPEVLHPHPSHALLNLHASQPVAYQQPAVFFYPHHIHRRDVPHIQASVCGNMCTNDHECPGTKKCCATECGFSCFDAVHHTH